MISICGVDNVHNGDEADDDDDEDCEYDEVDDNDDDQILPHLRLRIQQLENSPHSTLQTIF